MLIHKKYFNDSVLPVAGAMVLALAGVSSASMVTVREATSETVTGNTFGGTSGFAIDFNTDTPGADYDIDLVPGTTYSVDSVTVFSGGNNDDDEKLDADLRVGVYTTLTTVSGADQVSGFLGVSTNTNNFSTIDERGAVTYDFSGITVVADGTPNGGSGLLYFAFQTGTEAVTNLQDLVVSLQRIDNGVVPSQGPANYLSAILQSQGGTDFRGDRSPEYQATVSIFTGEDVPEPLSAAGLMVGLGVFALRRGRRGVA